MGFTKRLSGRRWWHINLRKEKRAFETAVKEALSANRPGSDNGRFTPLIFFLKHSLLVFFTPRLCASAVSFFSEVILESSTWKQYPIRLKYQALTHFSGETHGPNSGIIVLVIFLILVAAAAIIPGRQQKRTEKEEKAN